MHAGAFDDDETMDPHTIRLNRINERCNIVTNGSVDNHPSDDSDIFLSELTSLPVLYGEDYAQVDGTRITGASGPLSPLAETIRDRPRLVLNQAQAIMVILILSCALATSLTLLIRQRINYGNSENLAELVQDMGNASPDEAQGVDAESDESTESDDIEPQAHDAQISNSQDTEISTEPDANASGESVQDAQAQNPSDIDNRINLNMADATQLMTLNGVGPVMAERILEYRKSVGSFRSVDELLEVSGIGAKTLEKLRPQVRIQ